MRKHSISTTDPVFPNIIYLLQAFNLYRHSLNGAPGVIKISAPPESQPVASMMAQFSNSVSGCYTFGPDIAVEFVFPLLHSAAGTRSTRCE